MRAVIAVVVAVLLAQAALVLIADAGHGGGEILRDVGGEIRQSHGGGEIH